ncbi:unnamed protein product, partial [Pylaiella littoralis]
IIIISFQKDRPNGKTEQRQTISSTIQKISFKEFGQSETAGTFCLSHQKVVRLCKPAARRITRCECADLLALLQLMRLVAPLCVCHPLYSGQQSSPFGMVW